MDPRQVISSVLRAANSAAQTATNEENNFETLLNETRSAFRRRESGTPRGRKRKDYFSKKIVVLKLANADFLPGNAEQKYLKERGLGQSDRSMEIFRTATLDVIKEQLLELFPENIQQLLRMSGFILCRCTKSKRLEPLNVNNNFTGQDLENSLGQSKIIIKPLRDFPSNLPIVEYHDTQRNNSDTPSSNSVLQTNQVSNSTLNRRSRRLQISHSNIQTEDEVSEDELFNEEHFESYLEPAVETETYFVDTPHLDEHTDVENITIDRSSVVSSMFELYSMSTTICDKRLNVQFNLESGIDGGGLSDELFSIFWSEIFAGCEYFHGYDALVPYLPLHRLRKCKPNFKVLGKIIGHMILLSKGLPNKLALYTLFALANKKTDYLNDNLVIQDFLCFFDNS
ncbi:hypothetical protein FQR65_LT19708 [Abscondita terminalis]|nr:hypothetical protein FQR65_LT19708 [Abscondita terminalis]